MNDDDATGLLAYAPAVAQGWPGVVAGLVLATGIDGEPSSPALHHALAVEAARASGRLGADGPAGLASIAAWRRAFAGFGASPTRHRNAAEALLRRAAKGGGLPSVSRLVDVGTLTSVRHALPVAAFDLDHATGALLVARASGGEEFVDVGGILSACEAGEVVFTDTGGTIHARRWCWKQSRLSATRPGTRRVLYVVEGLHATASTDVTAARDDLANLLLQEQPTATVTTGTVRAAV